MSRVPYSPQSKFHFQKLEILAARPSVWTYDRSCNLDSVEETVSPVALFSRLSAQCGGNLHWKTLKFLALLHENPFRVCLRCRIDLGTDFVALEADGTGYWGVC